MLELVEPGSYLFDGRPLERGNVFAKLVYFSLVTLSTLGYGDIIPVSPPARMFAAVEAITGQLYLATLIASLISVRASQSRSGASAPPDQEQADTRLPTDS
jgi:hypothetical protein